MDTEFYRLPLRFDAERLAAEIAQFSEAEWGAHPQGHEGNTTIPLIAVDGNPQSHAVKGAMRPTSFLLRSPYMQQVLASFNTVLGRSRLMRIAAAAQATEHVDTNYYWFHHVRIHVPAVTFPQVRFLCNGKEVHMAAGEAWIFDTFKMHNVLNEATQPRIHLVADTVGTAEFHTLLAGAERPFDPNGSKPATPRLVPFRAGEKPQLTFESVNSPLVMTPYEQEYLVRPLLADLKVSDKAPPEHVAALVPVVEGFLQRWRGLWAAYGDRPEGWPAFKQALADFDARINGFANAMRLTNRIEVVEILRQTLIRPAVNPDLASGAHPTAPVAPAAPEMMAPAAQPAQPVQSVQPVRMAPPEAAVAARTSINQVLHSPSAGFRTTSAKLERPIFVLSAPRSGSTLLFETLARAPGLFTVGGESHNIFESIPKLRPAAHEFDSNRLTAEQADPMTVEQLKTNFQTRLMDRRGQAPAPELSAVRMLEKTPKNALRVGFLNRAFPDALFVYLYREPRDAISSIIDAWKSTRFVTYPKLPGWNGPPWSLLLIEGWRELKGKPVEEIAAEQWRQANKTILNELEMLDPKRCCAVDYAELLADPEALMRRICAFAGLGWDQKIAGKLPNSRHTLTAPDPEKWRKNEALLAKVLPGVESIAVRARKFLGDRPPPAAGAAVPAEPSATVSSAALPAASAAPASIPAPAPASEKLETIEMNQPDPNTAGQPEQPAQPGLPQQVPAQAGAPMQSGRPGRPGQPGRPGRGAPNTAEALRSVHTSNLLPMLRQLNCSLLVTTYQAGKLIAVRPTPEGLNTHFRTFMSPMGLALDRGRLAMGTKTQVWEFRNQPDVGRKLEPKGRNDACYMPRSVHYTGDIRIHEIAWADKDLWIVNTRFSCLCTLDRDHSFVPVWRPPWVTGYSPTDRCHLNGLAMFNGKPRWVTALGQTDHAGGWRDNKASGGLLWDIPAKQMVATGLSMPHSPRWYQDKLYVLESGKGSISTVDPKTGQVELIATLPGFTRGLDFAGPFAFVGLSQVRETATFAGLPITESTEPRYCGVYVVDLRTKQIAAFLRFEGAVQEIFAVQVLPNQVHPEIVTDNLEALSNSFVLPDAALREVDFQPPPQQAAPPQGLSTPIPPPQQQTQPAM
ncbi:MAG: TIGR03032 family protein [Planctomycetes bacterium]|nr:TIGR03032 family protein [Planctomycetota bacterium]